MSNEVDQLSRNRLTIASLVELIISSGIVIAVVRDFSLWIGPRLGQSLPNEVLGRVASAAMMAIGLVGGLGLAFETMRGSRPSAWSLGRWVWSISGFYVVLSVGWAGFLALCSYFYTGSKQSMGGMLFYAIRVRIGSIQSLSNLPWIFMGLCFTAYVSKALPESNKDWREWSGRLYASLVIATSLGIQLYQVFYH